MFKDGHTHVKIGKVLQLALIEKGKQKPFKGNYVLLHGHYGVLCTWYSNQGNCHYKVSEKADFNYYTINNYICTITKGCLVTQEYVNTFGSEPSVLDVKDSFTLAKTCSDYITQQITIIVEEELVPNEATNESNEIWVQIDKLQVYMKDKNVIISGKRLTELLISAAQKILCNQFPAINGLQPTVYQQKYSLPQTKDSIQIVHV